MRIDAVNLYVKDIKKMVEFYRDVMLIKTNWNGESSAEFEVDGIRLVLSKRDDFKKLNSDVEVAFPKGVNGTCSISFDYATFKDVDEEFDRIINLGGMPIMEPKTMEWGQRVAYVSDPEANLVELSSFNVFQLLGESNKETIEFNGIE